jgi:hypothetical protein
MVSGPSAFRQQVESIIAEYLGARTAESAVRIASTTWTKRDLTQLTKADLPALRSGLAPMLKTFLGAEVTAVILARLDAEVER